MKKIGIFILLSLYCSNSFSQNLDSKQVNNLFWLSKAWGYIKYHHPAVIKGQLNWDSILVKTIEQTKFTVPLEQIINNLIKAAGTATGKQQTYIGDSLFTYTDFTWMDQLPGSGQRSWFCNLKNIERPDEQYYVTNRNEYGKANWALFLADTAYKLNRSIDGKMGLLMLFRYWNAVNYFYPFKNFIRQHWDSVLLTSIPGFYAVNDRTSLLRKTQLLGVATNDGHSYLSSPFNDPFLNYYGSKTIAFRLKYVEGKFVIVSSRNDTLFEKTGLRRGDIILAKDGKSIEELMKERIPYTASSNTPFLYYRIGKELLDSDNDSIILKIQRGEKIINKTIALYRNINAQKDLPVWKKISPAIAFVQLDRLVKDTLSNFFKDIENTRTLIIDARGYPRFNVLFEFLSYVQERNIPFARWQTPFIPRPGYFYFHTSQSSFYYVSPKLKQYKGKLILLVDESCGSLGEYFPQALQHLTGAITVGSQTGGFDGNITGIPIPGGGHLLFSGLGVSYPDGTPTQQTGLKINYEVKPTIKGLMVNRDEVLEYAIELSKSN